MYVCLNGNFRLVFPVAGVFVASVYLS